MNICKKKVKVIGLPKLIPGHLYSYGESIFIYYCTGALVNLKTGTGCNGDLGFGALSDKPWEDVTDKYCLQEI